MKKEKEQKLKWRKLDNSAKIFPIISNRKFSSVFRISAVLTEQVDPNKLKEAVIQTLEYYTSFKVRLKRGFFWYYLEYNTQDPIILEENSYPCKYIDKQTNHNYLFKITYYHNKINLDMFHSLTDGSGALDFLKSIIYCYIQLSHPGEIQVNNQEVNELIDKTNTEDSYMKYYKKKLDKKQKNKKAYLLKGKKLSLYGIGVTHQIIDLKQVIKKCRKEKVSITQYFTAMLIYAIYQGNLKGKKPNKPIKICIPVNLKQYFDSTTITNFFSYFTVQANIDTMQSFEDILTFVKSEFNMKLTKQEIARTMSANVKIGNNFFVRVLPLFLKKVTTKIGYMEIRKYTTTTFSNIGKINVLPEYAKYVEQFLFLIAPEKGERIKCTACSYGTKMIVTFTSILENTETEEVFADTLKQQGILVETKTNDVYPNRRETKLYPEITNSKKMHLTITLLLSISVFIGAVCLLINFLIPSKVQWSFLCVIGIIYIWTTALYSIRRNVNIASHVMLQTISIFLLTLGIDWILGFSRWSVNMALPIIASISNITILVLYIVTYKKYFKYILYQCIIFLFAMLPLLLQTLKIINNPIGVIITTCIAVFTLITTVIFSGKDIKEEIERRFYF